MHREEAIEMLEDPQTHKQEAGFGFRTGAEAGGLTMRRRPDRSRSTRSPSCSRTRARAYAAPRRRRCADAASRAPTAAAGACAPFVAAVAGEPIATSCEELFTPHVRLDPDVRPRGRLAPLRRAVRARRLPRADARALLRAPRRRGGRRAARPPAARACGCSGACPPDEAAALAASRARARPSTKILRAGSAPSEPLRVR